MKRIIFSIIHVVLILSLMESMVCMVHAEEILSDSPWSEEITVNKPAATQISEFSEQVPPNEEDVSKQNNMFTTTALNMRTGPGVKNTKIQTLPNGTMVDVIDVLDNGWVHILYQGQEGYVAGEYLSKSKPSLNPATGAAYLPYKMYLHGKVLTYKNGGQKDGQAIIDRNINLISTWGGAKTWSGTDNLNTHFIGHSHGAFKGLWNVSIGENIVLTDSNGNPTTYKVTEKFIVDDYGKGVSDGKNYSDYFFSTTQGETITLQTCKTSTTNWILRAEK